MKLKCTNNRLKAIGFESLSDLLNVRKNQIGLCVPDNFTLKWLPHTIRPL